MPTTAIAPMVVAQKNVRAARNVDPASGKQKRGNEPDAASAKQT